MDERVEKTRTLIHKNNHERKKSVCGEKNKRTKAPRQREKNLIIENDKMMATVYTEKKIHIRI
jgi:hypothetical protein